MQVIKPTPAGAVEVLKWLRRGEVVASPTETAYGLLADARSKSAVKKIFKIKGRTVKQATALVVADYKMANKYGFFSPLARKLARKYWPGPITLVVPAKGRLAVGVVQNRFVGMRVPKHRWLRQLVKKFNHPLTATSANISGQANIYNSRQVLHLLKRRGLKVLVDGGNLPRRKTSTVVRIKGQQLEVLRTGAIKIKPKIKLF